MRHKTINYSPVELNILIYSLTVFIGHFNCGIRLSYSSRSLCWFAAVDQVQVLGNVRMRTKVLRHFQAKGRQRAGITKLLHC